MYEAFFGLSGRPFAAPPDPDYWFGSESHTTALRVLSDGLAALHPLCVVTAESGHGKTLLVLALLQIQDNDVTVGVIGPTSRAIRDLTRAALLGFGRETIHHADPECRDALTAYLISEYGAGRRCLLVVDEAQDLSAEALASLHRYLDLNSDNDCLLQVVLVGGPDLLKTMQDPILRDWAQRMPLVCPIAALPPYEVAPYIQARLGVAGAAREIFSEDAIAAIAVASGGVPRLINAICDMALVHAFAEGAAVVDRAIIDRVVSEGHASEVGALAMLTPGKPPLQEHSIPAPAPIQDEVPQQPPPPPEMPRAPELIEIKNAPPDPIMVDWNPPMSPAVAESPDESMSVGDETLPTDIAIEPVEQYAEGEGPTVFTGWPSISGRVMAATSARTTSGASSSLRRRFLPRG